MKFLQHENIFQLYTLGIVIIPVVVIAFINGREQSDGIVIMQRPLIDSVQLRELGGGDWEANVEQLKAENAKLAEAGGARITNLPSSGADDGDGGDGKGTGGNA